MRNPAIQDPDALLPPFTRPLPEFTDGVLLARLVRGLVANVNGGHDAPQEEATADTSVVARLRRIQRALAALRRLRAQEPRGAAQATAAIPLHLLHREIDVLEGRADAVVPLLLAIRRAYGDG